MQAPKRPSDPRPGGEPYYLDARCAACDAPLEPAPSQAHGWHDEWVCPVCDDGLRMDWPAERWDALLRRANNPQNDTRLEDIDP